MRPTPGLAPRMLLPFVALPSTLLYGFLFLDAAQNPARAGSFGPQHVAAVGALAVALAASIGYAIHALRKFATVALVGHAAVALVGLYEAIRGEVFSFGVEKGVFMLALLYGPSVTAVALLLLGSRAPEPDGEFAAEADLAARAARRDDEPPQRRTIS